MQEISSDPGLTSAIKAVGHFGPVSFDQDLTNILRETASALGYRQTDIVSGAGHDACWINRVTPTVMIMCPCVDGLSHRVTSPERARAWGFPRARDIKRAAPPGPRSFRSHRLTPPQRRAWSSP
ncbi:M20/M25/M40 family metallo-hydrolase [Roseovarius sp. MMSF_3281]|uniref:M20/M25/M40 family metallo-hydrolase n=1 Tax=Roseovarius sp. MMSF_3281 TaxID=3046694 RepID=UPI00273E8EF7|nr:M20/M25/M40 family metallo-hydrolase [Roseovarius sp. MMSF_3281]